MNCSCGCLEGPSILIFLGSLIHLRVLIFVCGEGEVVGVMAWLVPLLCLCLSASLSSPSLSCLVMSPWTVLLAAWRVQVYSYKLSSSSEFMFVFAEKKKCHSQVSPYPGSSSLSPDKQHSLGRSWQLQKTNLES